MYSLMEAELVSLFLRLLGPGVEVTRKARIRRRHALVQDERVISEGYDERFLETTLRLAFARLSAFMGPSRRIVLNVYERVPSELEVTTTFFY